MLIKNPPRASKFMNLFSRLNFNKYFLTPKTIKTAKGAMVGKRNLPLLTTGYLTKVSSIEPQSIKTDKRRINSCLSRVVLNIVLTLFLK